jgi:hypothetical protein
MSSSWQSRLAAKGNVISQKLVDNSINLSGILSDVLVIRVKEDRRLDATSISLEDITSSNMIFPKMEDIPLFRFLGSGFQPSDGASSFIDEKEKPIVVYAPITNKIDQGSLIVRVFEYPDTVTANITATTKPWILLFKVADVLGTFGARSMVWQKYNLTYPTSQLQPELIAYINQLATRRLLLKW